MSFFTALTGLNAAQTDLSTIANNIANAATNGFKKSRIAFGDIITASPLQDPARIIGSGTSVRSIAQQFSQGAVATSDSALDLAISGQGFFAVKSPGGDGQIAFTRNGAFSMTADRYVVDGAGRRVQIYPTTPDGAVLTSALSATQALKLPLTSGAPLASSAIKLAVNLSASAPLTTVAFNASDASTYTSATSVTLYDSLGNALPATVYYAKTALPTTPSPLSEWTAHVVVGGTELKVGGSAGFKLTFNNGGTLTSPVVPTAFDSFTPSTGGNALSLTLDHGAATTQQAGPFTVISATQDGYTTGRLASVAVDGDGTVRTSFTNGIVQVLGKVAVAQFSNPQGLKQIGNATYVATPQAGAPVTGEAGTNGLGGILSGSIEKSNVDLTEELVSLIVAQRNFQANAKTIDTTSTLLSTIINIR